jgi:hypothetical protein
MTGIIIKVGKGLGETLSQDLKQRAHINIQAVKGDRLALIRDTDDLLYILARTTKEIEDMQGFSACILFFPGDSMDL